jgi:hypothetical protein
MRWLLNFWWIVFVECVESLRLEKTLTLALSPSCEGWLPRNLGRGDASVGCAKGYGEASLDERIKKPGSSFDEPGQQFGFSPEFWRLDLKH